MLTQYVDVNGTWDVNMATGRPKAELVLNEDERCEVTHWRATKMAAYRRRRASRRHLYLANGDSFIFVLRLAAS